MIINIETIMRYFESEARPVRFEEAMIHFHVTNANERSHLRSKICELVRQRYLIKLDMSLWEFNYASRNICPRVDVQTG